MPIGGSIEVTNNGTMDHNVAITDTGLKLPDLKAGETGTLDVSSLDPGEYEIFCAISGHKDSGMTGTLIISDGSGGGNADAAAAADDMAGMDHSSMDIGVDEPGRAPRPRP